MATTIQQPDRRLYWGIAIAVFVLLVVALALRSNNMRNASTTLQQNAAPPTYEAPAIQGVAPSPVQGEGALISPRG